MDPRPSALYLMSGGGRSGRRPTCCFTSLGPIRMCPPHHRFPWLSRTETELDYLNYVLAFLRAVSRIEANMAAVQRTVMCNSSLYRFFANGTHTCVQNRRKRARCSYELAPHWYVVFPSKTHLQQMYRSSPRTTEVCNTASRTIPNAQSNASVR